MASLTSTGGHASRRTHRILMDDTDGDARAQYRASLNGCDVIEAADGRDALVKALSQRPALVITEIGLPIIDGYALCEVLRRDSMTRTVPILVVTTTTAVPELDRARAIGVDGVLTKPVTSDALLEAVERLIGRPCKP